MENPTGVTSATTKLNSHATPVEILVMGTRTESGAISLAYKKVRPRNLEKISFITFHNQKKELTL